MPAQKLESSLQSKEASADNPYSPAGNPDRRPLGSEEIAQDSPNLFGTKVAVALGMNRLLIILALATLVLGLDLVLGMLRHHCHTVRSAS